MSSAFPYVLSIAGLDPSGGAGLLADIKTFERFPVRGLGVTSAVTVQTHHRCLGVSWVSPSLLFAQIEAMLWEYHVEVVKVGIVESLELLYEIVSRLGRASRPIKVVWDPVFRASDGFEFMKRGQSDLIRKILSMVAVVTPNAEESKILAEGMACSVEASRALSELTAVVAKGGHCDTGVNVLDRLFVGGAETWRAESPRLAQGAKHGSGCVLSAALAAGLSLGLSPEAASEAAHQYTREYLASSSSLAGYHPPLIERDMEQ
jgi:hydroxymethylpyrimidine/phosphomethylpyrimidine kinase